MNRLLWWARLEGWTLLLLVLVAVPLKYLGSWPVGVRMLGPIHGLAFVLYTGCLIQFYLTRQCTARDGWLYWLSAFVPGGYLWVERRLQK